MGKREVTVWHLFLQVSSLSCSAFGTVGWGDSVGVNLLQLFFSGDPTESGKTPKKKAGSG